MLSVVVLSPLGGASNFTESDRLLFVANKIYSAISSLPSLVEKAR